MADGLPMAQIGNFNLGGTNIPMPNNAGVMTQGLLGGAAVYQQQQAIAQKQQEIQMAQKQQMIEKNMKMLETGSDMMLSGGPEVQETGKSLIQQAYPFLTGQPLPQGMPLDKDAAKDLGYFMDQHRTWQQTQGKEGLSAADAVTGSTQAISRYGMKYQQQQMGLLEKTPMYKEGMADQTGGQVNGQPATQNSFTGAVSSPNGQAMPAGAAGSFIPAGQVATLQNTNQQAATSNFVDMTKDHQEVLPNAANALSMVAQPVPANATETEKAEFALHDKQAMIRYAQMMIPSSKRPPNMTMEDMIKSGLAGEQIKTVYNNATNNVAMSNSEREAVTKTIAQTALNNEANLTSIENSSASRAIRNRIDPMKAMQNVRPVGIPSTSQLFQSPQVPPSQVQTGQIMKNPSDGKNYVFRGQTGTNDWKNKDNWMSVQ
jgi:hypothetical protein